jgi:hypothetical protein
LYEGVLTGAVRVITRDQNGFFADKAAEAMGDEDEGTARGVTTSSVVYKIYKKVHGMIDKSIGRRYRL